MKRECKICHGAKIAAMVGAFIINCHIYKETLECPFLPDEKHVQQEIQVPKFTGNPTVVTASAPMAVTHGRILGTAKNPYRIGENLYFIDVTASKVNR